VLRNVKNPTRILSLAATLVVALASMFVAASPAQAAYPAPGQFFYVREKDNSSGNHCLDVQGASTVYGTPLLRWDCNQGWNQSFVMGLTRFDGHPRSGAGRLREDVQHHGERG
jgi:hypothetical protein